MALSRLHTWIAGEVLTASDLNGEFNNIVVYVNALSFNALLAEGTLAAPSLAFASDTDTGFLHIRDGAFAAVSNGATIFIASAFFQASAFLFPVKTATEAVRTDMPGRAYWQSTEGSLHIHTGTLIARVPAITNLTAGDLIVASNATTYARLPIGAASQYLMVATAGGSLVYGSTKARIAFAEAGGVAAGVTRYLGPWAGDTSESTLYGQHIVPYAGRIRNFYVRTSAPGAGQDYKFTVRVNLASAFSTVTVSGAATSGSNLTDSFPVSPGDIITVQATASAAAATTLVTAALEIDCPS